MLISRSKVVRIRVVMFNALCPTHVAAHHPCSLLPGTSVVAKVNNAPNLFGYDDNDTETTIVITVSNTTTARNTHGEYYTLPRHTYTAHMARLNEPPIAPQPSAETIDAGKDAGMLVVDNLGSRDV